MLFKEAPRLPEPEIGAVSLSAFYSVEVATDSRSYAATTHHPCKDGAANY